MCQTGLLFASVFMFKGRHIGQGISQHLPKSTASVDKSLGKEIVEATFVGSDVNIK